jgi:cytochrome P450
MASRDTDIAGTIVRRGEGVIIYLAGANRDPKVFTDPHRFDIERENAGKHLSFSGGRHFCLGAVLARAEGEVGLRTFFERFPDARLAGGWRQPPRHSGGAGMVIATDHAWKRPHRYRFVAWISARRCSTRPGSSGN